MPVTQLARFILHVTMCQEDQDDQYVSCFVAVHHLARRLQNVARIGSCMGKECANGLNAIVTPMQQFESPQQQFNELTLQKIARNPCEIKESLQKKNVFRAMAMPFVLELPVAAF